MFRIILASARPQDLKAFRTALSSNSEIKHEFVGSGTAVLEAVGSSTRLAKGWEFLAPCRRSLPRASDAAKLLVKLKRLPGVMG
jgi:hypothetical protein